MFKGQAIDISRHISSEAVVYPGDDPLRVERLFSIGPSAPCNLTALGWTTHFLTHVDPPLHFVEGGASLDDVPLTRFMGEALVVEVKGDAVLPQDIPELPAGMNVLFKTRNSTAVGAVFDKAHVYIAKDTAEALVGRRVNLVGIDYLSVDRFGDESYPAHRTLLGNNILILEGIDLRSVLPGRYELIALPLKIKNGDGSPVRAVLIKS